MRIITTGRFLSVCEPNAGREYDDRGNLVKKSRVIGSSRRTAKKQYHRALRRMPVAAN